MTLPASFASLLDLIAARWSAAPLDGIQRLVEGAADAHPGCWVDKFGPLCVLTLYAPLELDAGAFAQQLRARGIEHWICKRRSGLEGGFDYACSDEQLVSRCFLAREGDCVYEIRCDPKQDFGIYTDASAARRLVAQLAPGRTVLNLFAYTCAFGVVAMKTGASSVTNVDPSKAMLTWGKRNAELNAVDFAVVPDTAQKYLRRARERKARGAGASFDLVVLDPPAFGVGRGDERLVRKLWPELLSDIVALEPEHVVLGFNDLAYRRAESVEALVGAHFDRAWGRTWFDGWSRPYPRRSPGDPGADPYFAPPLFAHLRRG